ncbi:YhjD/YihY/BrkB family envelope integrity protein [Mesorhizobium sp. B2-5-13]|uniref:YihY/virulence factor BrkB family protein n=1 Tax=unclassified Mesorhizobium TaxID=325217 RepID=UPI0032B26649
MLEAWRIAKASVAGFIADGALSHGAAMAFFAVTSLGPVLLLVVAVAGLVFGHDAARTAIAGQLSGLMGPQSAEVLQSALQSASNPKSGMIATLVGLCTLLLAASGVFGEMQSALNIIWRPNRRKLDCSADPGADGQLGIGHCTRLFVARLAGGERSN